MDPLEALRTAISAWLEADLLGAADFLGSYQGWRAKLGYEPALDVNDDEIAAFQARFPDIVLEADFVAAQLAQEVGRELQARHGFTSLYTHFTPKVLDMIADACEAAEIT